MKPLSRREILAVAAAGVVSITAGVLAVTGELGPTLNPFTHEGVISGTFYSYYRRRRVGYSIGYPSGHQAGSQLPLVVFCHGFRGSHENCLAGYSPAGAVSVSRDGRRVSPMALVTVDGGNGYWHPHPDDDPMGMIIHELIPMMQRRGLGVRPGSIGAMGISMGGYGAIALAQHYPHIFRAVAAISPAIFASYDWVHYVNPGAYWGPADFAKYDAITHVSALRHTPVRVASGDHDPFHPWVEDFVRRLPASDPVVFPPGEHNGAFFYNQIAPSIEFLAAYLATPLGSQS